MYLQFHLLTKARSYQEYYHFQIVPEDAFLFSCAYLDSNGYNFIILIGKLEYDLHKYLDNKYEF